MLKLQALGKTVYYDERSTFFSLGEFKQEQIQSFPPIPPIEELIAASKPTAYTFCVDVSDSCNLRCDYCFNETKTGKTIDAGTSIPYLEAMFDKYGTGEKYFVDMSGKGSALCLIFLPNYLSACIDRATYKHHFWVQSVSYLPPTRILTL